LTCDANGDAANNMLSCPVPDTFCFANCLHGLAEWIVDVECLFRKTRVLKARNFFPVLGLTVLKNRGDAVSNNLTNLHTTSSGATRDVHTAPNADQPLVIRTASFGRSTKPDATSGVFYRRLCRFFGQVWRGSIHAAPRPRGSEG